MFGALVARMLPLVPLTVVRRVARRYVAGEDLQAALDLVRVLNRRDRQATLDILGEDARDDRVADQTLEAYLEILDSIAHQSLGSNISVKLTHLGLRLDVEKARKRLFTLAERAAQHDSFVRIDMEDSSITDITLDIHREADRRYGTVGTVLQSYLRRTEDDARVLAGIRADIRLCKGIYVERPEVAFQGRQEIRDSFLRSARVLMAGEGTYVGFATHDRTLVAALVELVEEVGFPRDRFEFQVLLGVPVDDVLDDLVERGFKVRVYVPFGEEWYPYATRRLKENPKLAAYVLRNLFSRARTR